MTTTFEVGKTYEHPYGRDTVTITKRTPKFLTIECNGRSERVMIRGKDKEFFVCGSYRVYADRDTETIKAEKEQAHAEKMARIEAIRVERNAIPLPQHTTNTDAPEIKVGVIFTWALNNDVARLIRNAYRIDVGGCCIHTNGGHCDYSLRFKGVPYEIIIVDYREGETRDRYVRAIYGAVCMTRHSPDQKFSVEPNFTYYDERYMEKDGTMRNADGSRFEWATPY